MGIWSCDAVINSDACVTIACRLLDVVNLAPPGSDEFGKDVIVLKHGKTVMTARHKPEQLMALSNALKAIKWQCALSALINRGRICRPRRSKALSSPTAI